MKANISLGNKIVIGVAASVLLAIIACVLTVYFISVNNRVTALREDMSSLLSQSETMIENMDAMHRAHAFDQPHLVSLAKEEVGNESLKSGYAKTSFYDTIPVVAAWKSVAAAAKKSGYDFYTPASPGFEARNRKNSQDAEFAEVFAALSAGQKEYFFEDKQKGELVLAHPIYLSESCLTCHGNPEHSPTKNGLDVLGFKMENGKVGDLKGAFVLKAKMSHDPVVKASMTAMLCVGGAVLTIVIAGFYFFNARLLVRPMRAIIEQLSNTADQTKVAAVEISSTSQTVAEAASEQAASLEETSASLEEISSMTKRNADNAINGKQLSQKTSDSANQGLGKLAEMGHTVDSIKSAVSEMESAVKEMQGSSQEIAKIIKTIDEIAFQTNLLALNAAVEAARAGEAGMGFAVVADEVRALAQRSAQAARDTSEKIEAAIKRSDLGGVASAKVVKSLTEVEANVQNIEAVFNGIVTQIKSLDSVISEIAAASQEQSSGMAEVNMAVSQMDKVTQSNAASAEENAGAAESLQSQATTLRSVVTDFELMVNGSTVNEVIKSPGTGSKPAAPKPRATADKVEAKSPASLSATGASSRAGITIPMPEPTGTNKPGLSGFKDF